MDMFTCGVDRTALKPDYSTSALESVPPASTATANPVRAKAGTVCVLGLTLDGKKFRPSDWAERLAGAMSSFSPEGSAGGIAAFIGYSPYCVPTTTQDGVKCVIVSEELRAMEPMAWDFVMNFASDNKLQLIEADSPTGKSSAGDS